MKSLKNSIKHLWIDGQHILFPSLEDWKLLQKDYFIDGEKVYFINEPSFWSTIEFVYQYPELTIGLGHSSAQISGWTPYIFIHIDSTLQRIHLETLTCDFCGWRGRSANPMLSDSYMGEGVSEKRFQLMKAAERYPIYPCPNCGEPLPRHSIWVEY
jgi:predicted RNA-binding Zn-ribbon protein involved in translation (DUF1610 family)